MESLNPWFSVDYVRCVWSNVPVKHKKSLNCSKNTCEENKGKLVQADKLETVETALLITPINLYITFHCTFSFCFIQMLLKKLSQV